MWREILYSAIGHVLVLIGLVFPAILGQGTEKHLTVYTVRTVTPKAIEHLMEKSASAKEPKRNIPQVIVKQPDRKLPKETRRPKQVIKKKNTSSETSSGGESKGEKSLKTPIKGIELDSKFDYPEYLIEMQERIKNNWHPPTLKESLTTRMFFKLGKDGKIIRVRVEKATGNIGFDSAAMTAVTKSSPFSPLPEEFEKKELGVHFDFIYDIND